MAGAMTELLRELEVLPLYGQVTVQDVDTTDIPDWQTGEERAVSTAHAVLVATRPDTDGKVTIRVVRGRIEADGALTFSGSLSLNRAQVQVGNAIAGTLERVDIRRTGIVHIEIAAEPERLPSTVTIAIDDS